MGVNEDKKSYIFLDESGKPEVFSRKGLNLVKAGTTSEYLVISAVRTGDHLAIQQAVTEWRLKILRNKKLADTFSPAYSLNSFHAQAEDIEVIFSRRDASLKARERLNLVTDTLRIAYGVFQVFERGNREWYEIVKNRIGYIQDIFKKKSYSRSDPL